MTYSPLKSIATTNKQLSPMGYRNRSPRTKIANGRHIAAGAIITNQITANSLPSVNSVIHRRQAQANRKKLFNGKHLYVVGNKPQNNMVADNADHMVAENYTAA